MTNTVPIELTEGAICEWCPCGSPAVALMIGTKLPICDYASRSMVQLKRPSKRPPRPGYIYFIQAGEDGPVKVGWSVNTFGRLTFLQTGHWDTLRIVHERSGTVGEERALHNRFAPFHIRNEWFEPVVLELIAEDLARQEAFA